MDDRRLELLMRYTTFHVTLYMSLTVALIGAAAIGPLNHWTIKWAVFCFIIAGACGGVIAVNVAEFDSATSPNGVQGFFAGTRKLKIWDFPLFTYPILARIEHLAFWIGLFPLAVTFLCHGGSVLKT